MLPQLSSKVGFDIKMTLNHHQKLNISNISAVSETTTDLSAPAKSQDENGN